MKNFLYYFCLCFGVIITSCGDDFITPPKGKTSGTEALTNLFKEIKTEEDLNILKEITKTYISEQSLNTLFSSTSSHEEQKKNLQDLFKNTLENKSLTEKNINDILSRLKDKKEEENNKDKDEDTKAFSYEELEIIDSFKNNIQYLYMDIPNEENRKKYKEELLDLITRFKDNPKCINEKTTSEQTTLLMYAVKMIGIEMIDMKKVINQEIINELKSIGQKLFALLLKHKADVNIQDRQGNTALHIAAQKNHCDIIEKLLNAKADINIKDNANHNTAHHLLYSGKFNEKNIKVLKLLLITYNQKLDNKNILQSILYKIIDHPDNELFEYLLQNYKHLLDKKQINAFLKQAIEKGTKELIEIAEILINHGADLKSVNNENPYLLIEAACSNNELTIDFFIKHNVNLNLKNEQGETALMAAIKGRNIQLIVKLINAGANFYLEDEKGNSIITLAYDEFKIFRFKTILNAMLEKGLDINKSFVEGKTLLHKAIADNKPFVFAKFLLEEKKANANSKDTSGVTPLMLAVQNDSYKLVKLLIDNKADKTLKDKENRTALDYTYEDTDARIVDLLKEEKKESTKEEKAFYRGKRFTAKEIRVIEGFKSKYTKSLEKEKNSQAKIESFEKHLKKIIDNPLNINLQTFEDDSTLLMLAVKFNNLDLVKLLIKYNANLDLKDNQGEPSLIKAIKEEFGEIAKELINNGANVNLSNKSGETPLMYAVIDSNYDLVELLLENRADRTLKNLDAKTALDIANEDANNEDNDANDKEVIDRIIKLLTKKIKFESEELRILNKFEKDYNDYLNKNRASETEIEDFKNKLRQIKENPNEIHIQTFGENFTLMRLAIKQKDLELVKLLIKKNANLKLDNSLLIALDNYNFEIIKELLEYGANPNIPNAEGLYPIHIATQLEDTSQSIEAIHRLVIKGAYINQKSRDGKTPLILAINKGNIEVVAKLLYLGAYPDLIDDEGVTPLIHAVKKNNFEIVELLIKKGNGADKTIKDNDEKTALDYATNEEIKKILNQEIIISEKDIKSLDLATFEEEYIKFINAKNITKEKKEIEIKELKTNLEKLKTTPNLLNSRIFNDESNLLMLACDIKSTSIVFSLINLKVNLNAQDKDGNTALLRLFRLFNTSTQRQKRTQCLLDLLKANANPNIRNYDGEIALDHYLEIMDKIGDIFENGKNIIEVDLPLQNGNSLLNSIIEKETAEDAENLVKKIIEFGADVDFMSEAGYTPLTQAIARFKDKSSVNLINILLKKANLYKLDKQGETPLTTALKLLHENSEISNVIDTLVDNGANINTTNKKGELPVNILFNSTISETEMRPILKLFIKKKLNINQKDSLGNYPIHYLVRLGYGFVKDYINDLKLSKKDFEVKNDNGETPLMWAVKQYKNLRLINFILKPKKNKFKLTKDDIKILINATDNNGETVLFYALKEFLPYTGNPENAPTEDEILEYRKELIKSLLKKGCNINIKNNEGKTAKEVAEEMGHPEEIFKLFDDKAIL